MALKVCPFIVMWLSVTLLSRSEGSGPVVSTTAGKIQGKEVDGVVGFLGVPFAQPPIGKGRFAAPLPLKGWGGIRDSTQPAPACIQSDDFGHTSEDCLYLNAFSPVTSLSGMSHSLRPVMVNFHGGGFASGEAGRAWNFTRLTDVIMFLPQYRLGVMGFFSTSSPPPILGIQDQQFVLQWVQQNAKAFGGDLSRVMIFGGSAGGASVAGHLVLPASRGLFTSAGIESPGGHQGWMGDEVRTDDDWMSPELNLNHSARLAEELGCNGSHDFACLQRVDINNLYVRSQKLRFAPALPLEGQFPLGLIQRGQWNRVPIIIGGVSCESCDDAKDALGPPSQNPTEQAFRSGLIAYGLSGVNRSEVGPEILVSWYESRITTEGLWRTFARILGDSGHSCSTALHSEALQAHSSAQSRVWRYIFDLVDPDEGVPGATHGSDGSWILDSHLPRSPAQALLEKDMAHWWASLAAYGDPNAASSSSLHWPQYSATHPCVLVLDTLPHVNVTVDTVRAECTHWKRFLGWEDDYVELHV